MIHCSYHIVDKVGHANIISSCEGLLASPDSVLLTNLHLGDVYLFEKKWKLSILDYIEACLCCPLSLIPTLYGVKLTQHLQMRSIYPVKLHEIEKNLFISLKWQLSSGYSRNIPLEISSVMETAIKRLASARFNYSPDSCCGYPLYTYYLILQSLWRRCDLPHPATTILSDCFLTDFLIVPPYFQLNWNTEEAWMKGDPVRRYSFNSSFRSRIVKSLTGLDKFFYLILMQHGLMLSQKCIKPDQQSYLTLVQRTTGGSIFTGHLIAFTKKDLLDPSFGFLLVKDHETDLMLWIVVKNNRKLRSVVHLNDRKSLTSKLISNPTPSFLQPLLTQPERVPDVGLHVLKCSETVDGFQFDINVCGIQINDAKGSTVILFLPLSRNHDYIVAFIIYRRNYLDRPAVSFLVRSSNHIGCSKSITTNSSSTLALVVCYN